MKLIKLYRQMFEHRKEFLNKLKSKDYLWLHCYLDKDGDIVREIIKIEKNIK